MRKSKIKRTNRRTKSFSKKETNKKQCRKDDKKIFTDQWKIISQWKNDHTLAKKKIDERPNKRLQN